MEPMSAVYRKFAAREQDFAGEATLGHVRAMHERSAGKWLEFAVLAEASEGLKRR